MKISKFCIFIEYYIYSKSLVSRAIFHAVCVQNMLLLNKKFLLASKTQMQHFSTCRYRSKQEIEEVIFQKGWIFPKHRGNFGLDGKILFPLKMRRRRSFSCLVS